MRFILRQLDGQHVQRALFPAMIALGLCGLVGPMSGCGQLGDEDVEFPRRPIKVVVPFGAGGGSDMFTRIVQQAVENEQLLTEPMVIINVPGAGATVGSRRVKNARPDGYTVLCLHEAILTAKYSGNVPWGPEAFEPIAATSQVGMVIAVPVASPCKTLEDLLSEAALKPDTLLFGANLGAPSHFAGRLLEKAKPSAAFRYVQAGGGAKRFSMMQGGHIAVSAFSIAEYVQFRPAGLRAIALLSEQRHASIHETPTAREQGFDVIASNTHFWWAPKGTPVDRIAVIRNALRRAMQSESVRAKLSEIVYDPIFLEGEALREKLVDRERRIAEVAADRPNSLPNFPAIVAGVVIALAFVVLLQSKRAGRIRDPDKPSEGSQPARAEVRLAIACAILTIAYVGAMAAGLFGFRTATIVFVPVLGGVLAHGRMRTFPPLALIAVVMSIGLHFILTNVLVIDLP